MCVNESSEFTTSHKQPDHIRPHFCNLAISAPANGEAAFTVQRSLVRTVEQPLLSALRGSSRAASTPAVKQPLLQSHPPLYPPHTFHTHYAPHASIHIGQRRSPAGSYTSGSNMGWHAWCMVSTYSGYCCRLSPTIWPIPLLMLS